MLLLLSLFVMKMLTDWTNDTVIEFLELLESERAIWDPKCKNHKSRYDVFEAWKRISVNMNNVPIEELKAKKKSLMATFRPLLKKKLNSIKPEGNTDDVFQPVWFAFGVMERFLGPNNVVEDTAGDELNSNVDSSATQTIQPNNDIKKRPKSEVFQPDKAECKIRGRLDSRFEKRVEDECDVYAKLLAKKLRKYPEGMRDRIMYNIDDLLLDNPYPDKEPSNIRSMLSPPQEYVNLHPKVEVIKPISKAEATVSGRGSS